MKVDRLVSIIMILLERERIGAQELADMFEVSRRTIYRDIDAINMAGIPIRALSGVGGGFEIMEQYKVDNKVFSASDLTTLLMGVTNLSNMVHGKELANALAKVRSFIPADQARDIELKASQIKIDLSPWMENKNTQPYLQTIKIALEQYRLLSFNYIDLRGNQTERTVEPYQLVMKSGHWYFQGYCYTRSDYRLFKLSRMSHLQMQETTFAPREYKRPMLDIDDIVESMQTNIKIRIHRSIVERVLDFCTFEHFSPDGEEYYIVDFPFIENDYYYDMLFSFGERCECIEPLHVRKEMLRRIKNMADLYQE